MKAKKAVVCVTLVALLGSDLLLGIAPALGQTPGNGQGAVPSLSGSSDGTFGRVLPGPGTTAPYQQPSQQPPFQPQPAPQRQFGPTPANLCQPGAARGAQIVSVPRSRGPEAFPD